MVKWHIEPSALSLTSVCKKNKVIHFLNEGDDCVVTQGGVISLDHTIRDCNSLRKSSCNTFFKKVVYTHLNNKYEQTTN